MYDVEAVRAHFPALNGGTAHFDGPGGSQTPKPVADAIAAALVAGVSNRGHTTEAERRADRITLDARQAIADLLGAGGNGEAGGPGGAGASGVVFGRSMTQLTYDFARTLAKGWRPGDEVVVTRLDHDANIRPWVQAAAAAGAEVRWAAFDPETGELPVDAVTGAISDRTRLVAVTGASNLLGTMPGVRAISDAAHRAGALCYVDGVHLVPHTPVDVVALGADLFACSPYKFCGPHLGVVAAAPELLETLHPDKLLPSSDAVPERFELGTLPYELLAGVTAAVDFLAAIGSGDEPSVGAGDEPGEAPGGSRRERLIRSYAAIGAHEDAMLRRLEDGLDSIGGVTRYGRAARRTPLVLFAKDGVASPDVYRGLAARGVNAPAGSFYAIECSRWLGLGDAGAVRAGIAPYTSAADVDRLVEGVASIGAR